MASFMQKAHEGLPYKDFTKPSNGTAEISVCSVSGGLPTEDCPKITLTYLDGTQPTELCTIHSGSSVARLLGIQRLEQELYKAGFASDLIIKDSPLVPGLSGELPQTVTSAQEVLQEEDEFGNAPDYNFFLE